MTTKVGYLYVALSEIEGYAHGTLRSERTGRPLMENGTVARTVLVSLSVGGMDAAIQTLYRSATQWHRWEVTRVVTDPEASARAEAA